jgi:hypothetical protein
MRITFLVYGLNFDKINATRRVYFDHVARPRSIECSADRGQSRNSIKSDVCVAWSGQCVYFALTGLDVTDLNP